MADSDVVTNPDTGQTAKWDGTKWAILDSPFSLAGTGKALASGTLHEGFPGLFGAAGDVRDLANKGAAYAINKIKGTEGTDKEVKPEDISNVASKISGPISWVQKAPTSDQIRQNVTSKLAPEYQPTNMWERGANIVGSLLPGAALAPEAGIPAGLSLMRQALSAGGQVLRSGARYAVAPGLASQGVREGFDFVGAGDNPVKEPLAMAAMLAGPAAMNKLISPNPGTAAQRATGAVLDRAGATYTPKQLVGGDLQKEADVLQSPGTGTSPKKINAMNTENYNRGVLRTAFGKTLPEGAVRDEAMAATSITPELRGRIGSTIDNEFNRLASQHSLPLTKRLEGQLDNVVTKYDNEAILRKSPQLKADVEDIKDAFNNSQLTGFIDGRQYLNLRSRLSSLANAENDTSLAKGLRGLRDTLDDSMSQMVAKFYPQNTGAFDRARAAYQNNMVLDHAMNKAGGAAAHYNLSPDDLATSARSVLGHDVFGSETHPLAQLARAGQKVLEPLPKGEAVGLRKELPLLGMLAGGPALAGAGNGHTALGTALGFGAAAATYGARPVIGQLMGSALGRKYLSNQALPMESRPAFTRNPANAALIGEALARRREPNKE